MNKYWVMFNYKIGDGTFALDAIGITLPQRVTQFEEIRGLAMQIAHGIIKREKLADTVKVTVNVLTISRLDDSIIHGVA
jgi:hypothetical protein